MPGPQRSGLLTSLHLQRSRAASKLVGRPPAQLGAQPESRSWHAARGRAMCWWAGGSCHATSRGPRQAQLDGLNLHANVWVPPNDRARLERGAEEVAAERLEAGPIVGGDPDVGVEIEAIELGLTRAAGGDVTEGRPRPARLLHAGGPDRRAARAVPGGGAAHHPRGRPLGRLRAPRRVQREARRAAARECPGRMTGGETPEEGVVLITGAPSPSRRSPR